MRSAALVAIVSLLLGGGAAESADADSLAQLEAAVAEDPQDGMGWLQLGLARLDAGDARQAAHEFERAAEVDPELSPLALYNAAIAYAEAGDDAAAAQRARDVLALDPHPTAARSARELLERLETAARPWKLGGGFGLMWDDNVSQREVDVSSGRSDGAGVIDLGGSYRFVDDGSLRLEAGYDFYQTAYFHESGFDLQSHAFGVSGSRHLGPVEGLMEYRYSIGTLGGDYLLGFHELSPSVGFTPARGWHGVAGPRVIVKSLDDSGRDAVQSGLALDGYFFPNLVSERFPAGSFAILGFGFQHEDADAPEFDYDGVGLHLGTHLPFPVAGVDHAFDLTYRLRWRDYEKATPSIGARRLDTIHSTRLRLSRQLTAFAKLRLEYEFLSSNSNLPSVDYDQNTLSLGVAFAL